MTCLPISLILTLEVMPSQSTYPLKTPILINLINSFFMNYELLINENYWFKHFDLISKKN